MLSFCRTSLPAEPACHDPTHPLCRRDPVAAAIAALTISGHEERGAVFTRREVVDFILDLVGYTSDQPLQQRHLLEPAFGHGDFLVPAVERLLASYTGINPLADLAESIRGFEIHADSVRATRNRLIEVFDAHGLDATVGERLCSLWLDTPAFETDVIAYPAITVIARETGKTTRIAHRPEIGRDNLKRIARALRGEIQAQDVMTADAIVRGAEPWTLHAPDRTGLVRRLETCFPTLEEAGCQVGIGVATGADKIFIAPYDTLDIEADRKLPLVTTKDIRAGEVAWHGLGLVNPFDEDGRLVSLANYPGLHAYLERHEPAIRVRNVAKRSLDAWFRTIDRIYPALARRPKLLIPDIKGAAHIVLEEGRLYPHHNLYYIVSESWDLKALRAVLLSGIANLFVSTYSVKMAGGHLRFQAQYLRRIRLPAWSAINPALRTALQDAVHADDLARCRPVVHEIYGLAATGLAGGTLKSPITKSLSGKPCGTSGQAAHRQEPNSKPTANPIKASGPASPPGRTWTAFSTWSPPS